MLLTLVISIIAAASLAAYVVSQMPDEVRQSANDQVQAGIAARERGELQAALIAFKTASSLAPEDGRIRKLQAEVYLALGDGNAAVDALARATELGVDTTTLEVAMARALLAAGRNKDLLERPIPESVTTEMKAELLALHGQAHAALGNVKEAETHFRKSLTTSPHNPEAQLGLAMLATRAQDYDQARQHLQALIERSPGTPFAWLLLGNVEHRVGDVRAARDAFTHAASLPDDRATSVAARVAIAGLDFEAKDYEAARRELSALVAEGHESADISVGLGQVAVVTGDLAKARKLTDDLLARHPNLPRAWYLGGVVAYLEGRPEAAESLLRKVHARDPGSIHVATMLSNIDVGRGDLSSARRTLLTSLKANPEDPRLHGLYAQIMYTEGNLDEAIHALETRLSLEPESVFGRLALGNALASAGRTDEAIETIKSTLESNPKDPGAAVVLFLQLVRAGQVDRALALALQLNEKQPDNTSTLTMLGLARLAAGQLGPARTALEKAVALDPDHLTANRALADLARQEGNIDEERSIRARILNAHPDDLAALRQQASEQFQAGDLAAARNTYARIVAAHPTHLQTRLDLATLQAKTGEHGSALETLEQALLIYPDNVVVRLTLAQEYRVAGRVNEAAETLKPVASTDSNDPAVLWAAGSAFLEAGDPATATTLLERLVKQSAASVDAHYLLARAYGALGNAEKLDATLEKARTLDPTHLPTRVTLASRLIATGKLDEAATLVAELESTHGDRADVLMVSAELATAQGRPEATVASLEKLHGLSPSTTTTSKLALAQWQAGKPDQTLSTFTDWLERHPEDLEIRSAYANAHVALGNQDEGIKEYERVLQSDPTNLSSLNSLAVLYHETGRDGALRLAEKAHEIAGENPEILDTYGWLLVENGQANRGMGILRNAVKLAPQSTAIRLHYAESLVKMGEFDAAKTELRTLLDMQGNFPERSKAETILRRLE